MSAEEKCIGGGPRSQQYVLYSFPFAANVCVYKS